MLKQLLLTGAAVTALAGGAQASAVTWDFEDLSNTTVTSGGSGFGNSLTFTADGQQVRLTAWSLTSGGVFEAAQLLRYGGAGLGICNQGESTGCGSPSHQIDNVGNSGRNDFVLIEFLGGGTFDPTSATIRRYSSDNDYKDLDVTYWVGDGNVPLDLAGAGVNDLAALGFDSQFDDDTSNSSSNRTVWTGGDTTATALLFGGRIGYDEDDAFKLQSLTASYSAPPPATSDVSEPASLALLGLGVAALGLLVRHRRRN
ncbi:PEP-CTERM sorting domain-containing protein [Desertibaculum subflavum]|uniref:PEP-CTERM sorting domain-containing protein n=1 Tax=Desertibaculum subflavum TaxID=2268458 RepID=UPI000E673ED3